MSLTHQDLSNDTTFSQIKSRVPVPLNLKDFFIRTVILATKLGLLDLLILKGLSHEMEGGVKVVPVSIERSL